MYESNGRGTPRQMKTMKGKPVAPGSAKPEGSMATGGTPKAKGVQGWGERCAMPKGTT